MSRRLIIIIVASIAAIVLGNIVILSFWLPRLQKSAAKAENPSPPAAMAQASVPPTATNNVPAPSNVSSSSAPRALHSPAELPGGFVVERQVMSPSGNLRIKYLRNRKEKLRRITLEDVHRPESSVVLCESKRTAWVIVSPDDQWIALDERTGSDGGGARLYHRSNASEVRYNLVDDSPASGNLQDTIWSAYLDSSHSDPKTARHGVTIDAMDWDRDSRKLVLSVTYLASAGRTEIPRPWTCTYDVLSKQVEPSPPAESAQENASPAEQNAIPQNASQENAIPQDASQENAIPQNATQQHTAAADDDSDSDLPGEKFPATRREELTVPDVNESSLSEITYAINEMFARHGADFKDKKIAKQFSDFSWYQPRTDLSMNEIENEFSDLEKQNLKILERCRDAKVAAARRHQRSVRGTRVQEESAGEHFIKGVLEGVGNALTPDQ